MEKQNKQEDKDKRSKEVRDWNIRRLKEYLCAQHNAHNMRHIP